MKVFVASVALISALAIGQVHGANVCYFNGTSCAGEGVCRQAEPNTGACAEAAMGTYGTFTKEGNTYTLSFFTSPTCQAPPVLTISAASAQCVPVDSPTGQNPEVSLRIDEGEARNGTTATTATTAPSHVPTVPTTSIFGNPTTAAAQAPTAAATSNANSNAISISAVGLIAAAAALIM